MNAFASPVKHERQSCVYLEKDQRFESHHETASVLSSSEPCEENKNVITTHIYFSANSKRFLFGVFPGTALALFCLRTTQRDAKKILANKAASCVRCLCVMSLPMTAKTGRKSQIGSLFVEVTFKFCAMTVGVTSRSYIKLAHAYQTSNKFIRRLVVGCL